MKPRHSRRIVTAAALLLTASQTWAWGATGHRTISTIAAQSLPAAMPAFLRTAEAAALIGELGREPDRSKGAGLSHDRNLDPGHWVNLADSGKVADQVALDPPPATRDRYAAALRAARMSEYEAGYLPYTIIDGWQQLRKDFAYWRALTAMAGRATGADKTWLEQDRRLREMLILRDLGTWTHFIGDGSQPMHVSVHRSAWGDYPNPEGFHQNTSFHADFEGRFVADTVSPAEVAAALPPPRSLDCQVERRVGEYLLATHTQVKEVFRLEKSGAFAEQGTSAGRRFVVSRLAAAAAEARDLIAAAWQCSAEASVGYPPVLAREVEEGKAFPLPELRGRD